VAPIDRLSALDAVFLDLETPRSPLHVGWTLRLDGVPPTPAALRRHLDSRLDRIPRFRRRLAQLAGGLAWVDDPAFDVARHVHRVTLPAPGDAAALRDCAGALLSHPLDRDRPLWRMYLVDGLRDGGFALVGQAHHALVDGIAAIEVALLLFDDGSELGPSRWRAEAAPSTATALRESASGRARAGLRGLGSLAKAAARPGETAGALRGIANPAPQTGLDRSLTPKRVVGFGSAPLEDVREAARRRGATVNDVLLAASALALSRALARRGERPHALKALVPVNVRAEGTAAALGNAVSFAAIELPLGETDPTTVLRTVRDRTREAKRAGAARPLAAIAQAGDLLPAPGRRAIARAAVRVAAFNAVVSNVPGPPVELTFMGRRLRSIHPAVPMLDGHGLTIGALSYAGRLGVGVYADAAVLPDAVDVARDIESAFDALRLAPERPPAAGPTPWQQRARARRAARTR